MVLQAAMEPDEEASPLFTHHPSPMDFRNHPKSPTGMGLRKAGTEAVGLEMRKAGTAAVERELDAELKDRRSCIWREEYAIYPGLLATFALSAVLLAGNRHNWVLASSYNRRITTNRATAQIVVQVLSNFLAFFQMNSLCLLINRGTRLRFGKSKASLKCLRFWSHLCTRSMNWNLPMAYMLPLLTFMGLSFIPSALWAGALSPITVYTNHTSSVPVPSYANVSLIKEYPSEFGNAGQLMDLHSPKGIFTYTVAMTLGGALLSTASSATTVDGSPRKHTKLDNSGFMYIGRSYGVGASVGLTDGAILNDTLTTTYTYQEVGYSADVNCIYNSSAQFVLYSDSNDSWEFVPEADEVCPPPFTNLWEAQGLLPNSNGSPESSMYFGRDNGSSIVAIGVAGLQSNGTQYLGIASGKNYAMLNTTQCSISYVPTLFNVTVNIQSKNITVQPVAQAKDLNPAGNISHTTTRQFELLSNDQTNLYQSMLGNAFRASIGDFNVSQSTSTTPLSEQTSTLGGLTNSVTAMVDDILGGYASAQLMIGGFSTVKPAQITVQSIQIGQGIYIFAIFAFNFAVLLIVIEEMMRTKLWKGLNKWDYRDIDVVMLSSWKGGKQSKGVEAVNPRFQWIGRNRTPIKNAEVGKLWVTLDKESETLNLDTLVEVSAKDIELKKLSANFI